MTNTVYYPTDNELTEMLTLQAEVKVMEKRIEEIKKACKQVGSFFTARYTISVITQTRVGLAGLEEVKGFINEDILNKYGLIRRTDFLIVKVGKLPETAMPISK